MLAALARDHAAVLTALDRDRAPVLAALARDRAAVLAALVRDRAAALSRGLWSDLAAVLTDGAVERSQDRRDRSSMFVHMIA